MRIIVTGADGFVARWLIADLQHAGHEAVPLSRRDLDVVDATAVRAALTAIRPDGVAQLAGVAFGPDAAAAPSVAFETAVAGTINLVEAARLAAQRPAIVIAGSSEVYAAPPLELPLREDSPLGARTPYALSKLAQEGVALATARAYELPLVMTRSFNHTGPGQRPAFVVPALATRIRAARAAGEQAIRVGNLDVRRDIGDVRDVVRAYRQLLEALHDGSLEPGGHVLNVSTGRSTTIRSVLEQLLELAGAKLEAVVDPALVRPDEPPELFGSYDALRDRTGWHPQTPLATTLADVWQWVDSLPLETSPQRA